MLNFITRITQNDKIACFVSVTLRISQKVLIGINQFYRLYVGVCNDLTSKNLDNKKKFNYFFLFYNYRKYVIILNYVDGCRYEFL